MRTLIAALTMVLGLAGGSRLIAQDDRIEQGVELSRQSQAAARTGQRALALDLARQAYRAGGEETAPVLWWTMVLFGEWDAVLAEPLPPGEFRMARAMAYGARGMAFAVRRRFAEARAALDTIAVAAEGERRADRQTALRIAELALAGEIALRQGNPRAAVETFTRAVELEDRLAGRESQLWYFPMRQALGRALLAAHRPRTAEGVYREAIERVGDNGWAWFGLWMSLDAQGLRREAQAVRSRFEYTWRHADVVLRVGRD